MDAGKNKTNGFDILRHIMLFLDQPHRRRNLLKVKYWKNPYHISQSNVSEE